MVNVRWIFTFLRCFKKLFIFKSTPLRLLLNLFVVYPSLVAWSALSNTQTCPLHPMPRRFLGTPRAANIFSFSSKQPRSPRREEGVGARILCPSRVAVARQKGSIQQHGVYCVCLFDCCHSGTIADLPVERELNYNADEDSMTSRYLEQLLLAWLALSKSQKGSAVWPALRTWVYSNVFG